LGEDVFIGSTTRWSRLWISLPQPLRPVRPLHQNVDNAQLAVGRARQKNIDGWKRPEKIKKS
jgi:bifunctional UDP-N-acetylglucosamine pyrophosphorylase/glucosamine-1-phosphate N-acetyltransferase